MRLIWHREEQLWPRLQVWDSAPSTHSPRLIFRQIFITINLAWLRDIKIPRIDNPAVENQLGDCSWPVHRCLHVCWTRGSDGEGHFSGISHMIPNRSSVVVVVRLCPERTYAFYNSKAFRILGTSRQQVRNIFIIWKVEYKSNVCVWQIIKQ